MATAKHGIPNIRISINDLVTAARQCGELEIVAAGSIYATLVGYEEVIAKLNNANVWWCHD